MVNDLLACSDSFAAAEVSERVTGVGEKTVRRYLAEMVKGANSPLSRAAGRRSIWPETRQTTSAVLADPGLVGGASPPRGMRVVSEGRRPIGRG